MANLERSQGALVAHPLKVPLPSEPSVPSRASENPLGWLPEFALDAFPKSSHPPWELHDHGQLWEVVVVASGRGQHLTPGGRYDLKPRDVLVIPPASWHGYAECCDLELMNFVFNRDQLSLPEHQLSLIPGYTELLGSASVPLSAACRFRLEPAEFTELRQVLVAVHHEIRSQRPGCYVAATALSVYALTQLARLRPVADEAGSLGITSPLEVALAWAEQNLDREISVDDMAEKAHMSRRTLERAVRQHFGVSPLHYLNSLRISKAQYLLRESDLGIGKVARRVGFRDPSYFARLFRKTAGVDPSMYRRPRTA